MGFEEWEVVETLGKGAFGTVYKVKREKHGYTQYAAMKEIVLNSKSDFIFNDSEFSNINDYNDSLVRKILAEVETMDKVKGHTNIVGYEDYEANQDENGNWTVRIRMELLTPLRDYIKNKTLSRDEIIKIGVDICNALEICEKNGIIHRDVKTDNVFVSKNGDFKLGDFGTAKVFSDVQTHYTSTGTLAYMAPEVLMGSRYDSRADQYSLAVMLYYLLNNYSFPEKKGGEITVPPVNADDYTAQVIMKACSKEKEDRFASVSDFRDALEGKAALISGESKKPFKKLPIIICAVLALLVAAAVCTKIAIDSHNKKKALGETTVSEISEAEKEETETEKTTADYRILINNLSDIRLGLTGEEMNELFGEPEYTDVSGGYKVSVYLPDNFILRAAFSPDSKLAAYLVTDVYNLKKSSITLSPRKSMFRPGDKSFYEIAGSPLSVKSFSNDETVSYDYIESYDAAAFSGGKNNLFLFASMAEGKDIGSPEYALTEGMVDDEVSMDKEDNTPINRKYFGPNSYGEASGEKAVTALIEATAKYKPELLEKKEKIKAQLTADGMEEITFAVEEEASLEDLIKGTLADGYYTNEFAKIKIRIPDNYYVYNEKELAFWNGETGSTVFIMVPVGNDNSPRENGMRIIIFDPNGLTETDFVGGIKDKEKEYDPDVQFTDYERAVFNGKSYAHFSKWKYKNPYSLLNKEPITLEEFYVAKEGDYIIIIEISGDALNEGNFFVDYQ